MRQMVRRAIVEVPSIILGIRKRYRHNKRFNNKSLKNVIIFTFFFGKVCLSISPRLETSVALLWLAVAVLC
jgi:hypothetical protein